MQETLDDADVIDPALRATTAGSEASRDEDLAAGNEAVGDDEGGEAVVTTSRKQSAVTVERSPDDVGDARGDDDNDDEEIDQNDDGDSLCDELLKPSRSYHNNRFGTRISREQILHYVQNKQSGFDQSRTVEKEQLNNTKADKLSDVEEENALTEKADEEEEEPEEPALETEEIKVSPKVVNHTHTG